MQKQFTLKTTGFASDGAVCSEDNGKQFHIWDALPGETVSAHKLARKKGIVIATADEIITASPERVMPEETHYLSCSPWQILKPARELAAKLEIMRLICSTNNLELEFEQEEDRDNYYGYRNKMEFSIYANESSYSLAFFKRNQRGKQEISGCRLGSKAITTAAQEILNYINRLEFKGRAYKTVMLRSNSQGEVLASLFCKEKADFPVPDFKSIKGFSVYYSEPKSPASVATDLLYHQGADTLSETLQGKELEYDILSFFQGNIAMFNSVLSDLKPLLAKGPYLDLFCGAGAISIALSEQIKQCVLVDNNAANIEHARNNIRSNKLTGFSVREAQAEKLLELVTPEVNLLLDPPRSGLHNDLLQKIMREKPANIYYLSCNPETQIRDFAELAQYYRVKFAKIYNFFPRTPHIESLIVLERK
jgi:23S rRNA (uracil1939-C5)-methyltransferase